MSAIDIHTHAFPDEIAKRAIAKLEAEGNWQAVGDGTIAGLVQSMDAADIDISAVCAIATKPDQVKGIFKWCKAIRSDRIEPLPSVHPQTPKAAKWLRRFAKEGFAGIKLHPMYQDFVVDDPAMDPILSAAAECGLFVEMHCGNDIAFPHDARAAPARVRRVIDRHPTLKLVCTHLGGWRAWDESAEHVLGTGAYVETSFSMPILGPERAAEMIRRHDPRRVLFGTDWPWIDQRKDLDLLGGLDLTPAEIKGIRWANAARLLGY